MPDVIRPNQRQNDVVILLTLVFVYSGYLKYVVFKERLLNGLKIDLNNAPLLVLQWEGYSHNAAPLHLVTTAPEKPVD